MKQPTEQEIKEFWEGLGWYQRPDGYAWYHPDFPDKLFERLPPIDLNSLFRYAVPKAIGRIAHTFKISIMKAYEALFRRWLQYLEEDPTHPALALFWTIKQVSEK